MVCTVDGMLQVAPPVGILCSWYIRLLLEVYETVHWSFKEKLQDSLPPAKPGARAEQLHLPLL